MADEGELDLNHEGNISGDGFGVRKNIALKLKPSPKGKRGRKSTKQKKEEAREEDVRHNHGEYGDEEVQLPILKGPPEPQHKNKKLHWDHKVHLIGERVVDPLIHCCENCALPILIYGRMIPCKHVFCLDCAKKAEKSCPRCSDAVQRIEQAALGTVFVCTHGGAKHGVSGCRRTYLSNRDLQAHIQYRHLKDHSQPPPQQQPTQVVIQPVTQQNMAPAAVSHSQPMPPNQQAPTQGVMPPQRQEYPPLSIGASMPGIMPQQQGQPLPSNHAAVYPDQIHGLPQNFTSPPPPQQPGVPLTTHGGPPPGQGMVGPPPQSFHQPSSTGGSIESYQTVGQGGNPVVPGRGGNLIPVVMQEDGGYNTGMPPPGYIPGAPPPQRNYPPVSYAGNTGGPQQPPPQMLVPPPLRGGPGHIPRQGLPPVQNTHHGGIPPRYPPGQNPPFSQTGPGGPLPRPGPVGPRTWQGPGPGGPPQRGPPPQNQRGPNPSRY